MLSVKHIMPNGREIVRLVEKVEFDPVSSRAAKSSEDCDYIFIWVGRDFPERIEVGTVYVMNENGKTVATYKLGDGNANAKFEAPYTGVLSQKDKNTLKFGDVGQTSPIQVIPRGAPEWAYLYGPGVLPAKSTSYRLGEHESASVSVGGKISWGDGSGEVTQESGCISAPANTAGIR